MPWKIRGTCVHELNADGSLGKVVKCHDTPEQAKAHMRAMYANVPDAKTEAQAEPLRAGYFAERIQLTEATLDAATKTVRGVTLIKPGFSTNTDKAGRPRYYPAATLKQAAGIFEGTRAFVNHPRRSDEKELPERSVLDIAGYYESVQVAADGKLTGDLRVVGQAGEALWPLIVEAVEHKPDLVQLSINALGQTRIGEAEGRKALIVESIVGANSVDVVTTGAAGGSFAGALLASDGDGLTLSLVRAMAFEQWRECRPEYVDRLKKELQTVRDSGALKSVRDRARAAERKAADLEQQSRAETAELEILRQAATADRLLAGSKLPHRLRTAIRETLLVEKGEAAMKALLEREQAKYAAAPKPPVPVNSAGQGAASPRQLGKPMNRAAALVGIDESRAARPDESAEEYRVRRLAEVAH